METQTKICTKCGEELPATIEYFYKNGGISNRRKNGTYPLCSRCKKCHYILSGWPSRTKQQKKYHNEYSKNYAKENNYKYQKKYENSEKGKQKKKAYRNSKAGIKVIKLARFKYTQNACKYLTDYYIKNRIASDNSNISAKGIKEKEVIEAKRVQLMIHREIYGKPK